MFEISNFLKVAIAKELFGGVDLTKATSFTAKLFSDDVDLGGTGTELTTPEYEAFTFTNNLTNFPARTDGQAISAFSMQSAEVFSEDATYQSIGIFDHLDNLWFRKTFAPRTILEGQYQILEFGDLVLTIS